MQRRRPAPLSARRAARSAANAFERLEGRALFSVGTPQDLLAAGFAPTQWEGKQVFAKPGEWVLRLSDLGAGATGRAVEKVNHLLDKVNKNLRATLELGDGGTVLLKAPEGLDGKQVKRLAKRLPGFDFVEPNQAYWTTATPNDAYYATYLDGLNNVGQRGGVVDADIDAPEAWDVTTGSAATVVGVIDTGVDYTHPDLAANIWRNPGETAGDGIDNDRNGYVDDVRGWDFTGYGAGDNDPMDVQGHGTHVAGTIAAAGNNGLGMTGVSWNAKVMPLRVFDANGYSSAAGISAAINYATRMRRDFGVNVRVTNNSWGGGGFSQAIYNAVAASNNAGMLFVAAAGNDGADNDVTASYPANFDLPNVISVAATDKYDALASFSNYGAASVDIGAPGVDTASTYLGHQYVYMSGTSMAAPHVTGVAALAFGAAPGATAAQVRDAILNGGDAVASLQGRTATGRRLNARGTLDRLLPPNAAPAVAGVTVAGGAWSDGFLSTVGTAPRGYAVSSATSPVLPWANVDRVQVRFSEDVAVEQGDLLVRGANGSAYAVGGFNYDAATFTATWTLAAPVRADRLRIELPAAAVTDRLGAALGAGLSRPVNVLPGDVNGDGTVSATDLLLVRSRVGKSAVNPGAAPAAYTPFHDVNGDGVINASDLVLTRNRLGTALPAAAAPAPAALSDGLFSAQRVEAASSDGQDLATLAGL